MKTVNFYASVLFASFVVLFLLALVVVVANCKIKNLM